MNRLARLSTSWPFSTWIQPLRLVDFGLH
jgi:hypothetical protein